MYVLACVPHLLSRHFLFFFQLQLPAETDNQGSPQKPQKHQSSKNTPLKKKNHSVHAKQFNGLVSLPFPTSFSFNATKMKLQNGNTKSFWEQVTFFGINNKLVNFSHLGLVLNILSILPS